MNLTNINVVEFWDNYHTWNKSPATDVCDVIAQEIPKHVDHNASLLEIGCGSGVIMKHLMMSYANIVGCDISTKAVNNAKSLLGSTSCVKHVCSDSFNIEHSNYDLILLIKTLGAVGDDKALKELSNNATNCLNDRGTLLIIDFAVDPNINYFEDKVNASCNDPIKLKPEWSNIPFYHFSINSISNLFRDMRISFYKNINLLSCNNHIHPGIMCVLKKGDSNVN